MDLLKEVEKKYIKQKDKFEFNVGDTVRVYHQVKEVDKKRLQIFEGIVIRIRGEGINKTFTVRKLSQGVGIEKTFFYYSPLIDKIKVRKKGKVRRAKLYFLRESKAKLSKIKPVK